MKTDTATTTNVRSSFIKRHVLSGALLAVLVVGGSGLVLAEHAPGIGFGGSLPGIEMGPNGFEERMARILKLTDTQKNRIKAILSYEKEEVKPLFDRMHESRKLLMQAAEAAVYDEEAVRTITHELAQIDTELIVSQTRTHNRIFALLTPEQRELERNLRPDMDRLPMPINR
jgi:Spy/CpxP family protein refolding chaperone